MLVCYIGLLLQPKGRPSLRDLAYGRGAFEGRHSDLYVMAMNADGYNCAHFPVGVSSRRYLVDFGVGHDLTLQVLRNGAPKDIWRLKLDVLTTKAKGTGTLGKLLAKRGLQVVSSHLTRAQKAALSANVNFVGYNLGAIVENLWVGFVEKDGTEQTPLRYGDPNPIRLKRPFCPIPAEESRLLGFGAKEWHGQTKINIIQP